MIIAIDGYEANVPHRVGISRYAYEILKGIHCVLVAYKARSSKLEARIYLPSSPLPDMPPESSWWQYRKASPYRFWTFIGLPWALTVDRPRADVVFSPTHYAPRFVAIPRVVALMDTSYLVYPQMFRSRDLYQLTRWTAYSVAQAVRIITISQSSKDAIIAAYGVASERVVVTHPGLSMKVNGKRKTENGKSKYHLPPYYVLSVGTLQPRKNYVRLIEAFARVKPELEKDYPQLVLVIVGKRGWLYEEILEAPKRFGVEKWVEFLDFVPDEDLPGLYRGALCFVLPSLYEGFGLPVLEAIVQECPVVVSNVSSLPEVAGPAGIYVKPNDVASIAEGIVTAIKEYNTTDGKKRITAGLSHLKQFSWEKAARETLKILEEVAKSKH